MQELYDSSKRPNLQIMVIEEVLQAKSIENIFKKNSRKLPKS
jgi:hypothetical protein